MCERLQWHFQPCARKIWNSIGATEALSAASDILSRWRAQILLGAISGTKTHACCWTRLVLPPSNLRSIRRFATPLALTKNWKFGGPGRCWLGCWYWHPSIAHGVHSDDEFLKPLTSYVTSEDFEHRVLNDLSFRLTIFLHVFIFHFLCQFVSLKIHNYACSDKAGLSSLKD